MRVAEEVGITAGWGETDVLMEVSLIKCLGTFQNVLGTFRNAIT